MHIKMERREEWVLLDTKVHNDTTGIESPRELKPSPHVTFPSDISSDNEPLFNKSSNSQGLFAWKI